METLSTTAKAANWGQVSFIVASYFPPVEASGFYQKSVSLATVLAAANLKGPSF